MVMTNPTELYPSGGDDTQAIQGKLDSLGHASLPFGTYIVSRPLRLPFHGSIKGGGINATKLLNVTRGIPVVLSCSPRQWAPTVPFADTDGWILDGSMNRWINCSDAEGCEAPRLDGRDLNISVDFKPSALPDGENSLFGSAGAEDDTNDTHRVGFQFTQYLDKIRFRWRAGNAVRIVDLVGLVVGEWHTIRLISAGGQVTSSITRGGVVVATSTVSSGPIEQAWHESVCVGVQPFRFPDGAAIMPCGQGRIKNARIEGIVGGTFFLPLTEFEGPLFNYYGPHNRDGMLYPRCVPGDFVGDVDIRDMHIEAGSGIGIFSTYSPTTRIRNVTISGDTRGVMLWNNSYTSLIQNVRCFGAAPLRTIGITIQTAGTTTIVDNCDVQYGQCGMNVDLDVQLNNIYLGGGTLRRALICKSDSGNMTINGLLIGDEGISQPENTKGVLIAGANSFCINGFHAWWGSATSPQIEVVNSGGVLVAPFFRNYAGSEQVIKSTGTKPVKVIAPVLIGSQVLSLNPNVTEI